MSHHEFPEIAVQLNACYWAVYEPDAPDERPRALFTAIDDALAYGRQLSVSGVRVSPLWLHDARLFHRPEEGGPPDGEPPLSLPSP